MTIEVHYKASTDEVQARTTIDGVPYYGSGRDLREALSHLIAVLLDHGAPNPWPEMSTRRIA